MSFFFCTEGLLYTRASGTHRLASTPHGTWAYPYSNAHGPTAIYDACHGYHVVDSSTASLGYSDIHNTPSNQGQGPHLTSNPYSAGTSDGFTSRHEYGATNAAYGAVSAAYDATNMDFEATSMANGAIHATYDAINTAYGDASAANGAGINTCDVIKGIWPSTDPVSTLMAHGHGAADIYPSVYPLVPNPILSPGNLTTTPVQAGYEPAVPNTNGSRPQCSTCNTTFKRASDLARHQKKHQARRAFKCLVPGCNFKGSYRKDKLDAHVKSCHPRGAA